MTWRLAVHSCSQIGGIGPELNEDYSTSHIMTAHGFRGVFGIDTTANGDGPENFEDCMRQEYQWARSAMVLVTRYLPQYWPGQLTPLEMFRAVQANAWWIRLSLEAISSVAVVILGELAALHTCGCDCCHSIRQTSYSKASAV